MFHPIINKTGKVYRKIKLHRVAYVHWLRTLHTEHICINIYNLCLFFVFFNINIFKQNQQD